MTQQQKPFQTLKKSFTLAYPSAFLATAISILIRAKIDSLSPGFPLMIFAMLFFTYVIVLSTVVLFLGFRIKQKIFDLLNPK